MKISYYNKATIWGRPKEPNLRHTKKNRLPYLEMKIFCPSDEYGDIAVYGRMWGKEEKLQGFLAAYGEHPDAAFKFIGQLTQFEEEGQRYTGFHIFKWEVPSEEGKGVGCRAVFVLKGELAGRKLDGPNSILSLNVKQAGDYPKDETFEIFCGSAVAATVMKGEIVEVLGVMKDRAAFYGGTGDVIPYAQEIKEK